jgi:hypothetical protein
MAAASSAFKVKCPSCEAAVTVRDPALAGKKIDCPKCKYRFVVEAPEESDDTSGSGEMPKKAASPSAKSKKAGASETKTAAANGTAKSKGKPLPKKADADDEDEKSARKKGMNRTLLIGGGLAVLAIAVLVLYFTGLFDGDEPKSTPGGGGGGTAKQDEKKGKEKSPAPVAKENKKDSGAGASTAAAKSDEPKDDLPTGPVHDITNLLPNDSQWVLKINGKQFLDSPLGGPLFEQSSESAPAFKRWMGFDGYKIDQFVCAGGLDTAWFFGVMHLRDDVRIADLKSAMQLETQPKTIKKRDLYTMGSNDLVKMLGEYLSVKLASFSLVPPPSTGPRTFAVSLLDPRTVVIADKAKLEQFLETDAKRKHLTHYSPPNTVENTGPNMGGPGAKNPAPIGGPKLGKGLKAPGGANPPPGGPNPGGPMPEAPNPERPMPGGPNPGVPAPGGPNPGVPAPGGPNPGVPAPGGPNPGLPAPGGPKPGVPAPGGPGSSPGSKSPAGDGQSPFTTNPSYLTINPAMKGLLNQLEGDMPVVLAFAFKANDFEKLGGHQFVQQFGLPPEIPILGLPKSPLGGLVIKQMDLKRFVLAGAIEFPESGQAQNLAKLIQDHLLGAIAQGLSAVMHVPVSAGNSNRLGMPGNPGMSPAPGGPKMPGGGPGGPPPGPGMPPGGGSGGGPKRPRPQGPPGPPGGQKNSRTIGDLEIQQPLPGPGGPKGGPGRPPGPGAPPTPGSPPTPGGPGMNPGGPGTPGGMRPGGRGGPGSPREGDSTVSVTSSDKLLIVNINIDWSPVYYKHISPSVRNEMDLLKGESLMMTGRAHWHQLATTAKQLEAKGMVPFAAQPRSTNPGRFDLPYPADERVSWMADLLPFLGYEKIHNRIVKQNAWNDEANLAAGSAWISEFLNPAETPSKWRAHIPSLLGRELGATQFVALTGIGMDAGNYPDSPEFAKKLGMFGYDRQAAFADIANADGLGNTIYLIQVPPDVQRPWIRGGGSTSQGVPEQDSIKPFISVTLDDGRRGTHVIMADGSIRFISSTINDQVFQALTTYKGGEKIDNLDGIAPRVNTNQGILSGQSPPKEPVKEAPKAAPAKETKKETRKEEEESKPESKKAPK